MASELTGLKIQLKLNAGTTATGSIKTVSVSFPSMDKAKWATTQLATASDAKVLSIVDNMTPILNYMLHSLLRVDTYSLSDD